MYYERKWFNRLVVAGIIYIQLKESTKYAKLAKLLDSLHSSFWFMPTLIVVLAIALSFIIIWIDQREQANIVKNSLGLFSRA